MRCLHLTSRFGHGGLQQTLLELVRAGTGGMLIGCSADDDRELRKHGVPFVHVPLFPSTVPNLVRACRALRPIVRTFAPDVIHSHHRFSSLAGRLVAARLSIPFVHSVHDLAGGLAALSRFAVGRTVTVFSDAAADHVVRNFGVERDAIVKVALGVRNSPARGACDRTAFRAAVGCGPGDPVALFSGRLAAEKGPDVFVEALPLVLAMQPAARFWIAGEGQMRPALEARARALGVERSVTFLGWLEDVPRAVASADVIVVPSYLENLPRSAIEAMQAEKPVVATSVGGIAEVVRDGDTGLLVAPGRPDLIAGALTQLWQDRARAQAMGRAGAARARTDYSVPAMLAGFDRAYGLAAARMNG